MRAALLFQFTGAMSRTTRLALLGLAVGTLSVALVAVRPGGDSTSSATNPAPGQGKGADHDGHAAGHAPSRTADQDGASPTAPSFAPRGEPSVVIRTRGSQPVGGVTVLRAKTGDDVRFDVEADSEDDVHVHGYDVSAPAAPGKPAQIGFAADLEGIFEVELENAGVEIARVMVEPR